MKTTITILLTSIMMSCCEPNTNTKVNNVESNVESNEPKSEKIMGEVGHGLYKVKLDDTTTILLYRGVESCTMIQLK
jgi:hypothetical protein